MTIVEFRLEVGTESEDAIDPWGKAYGIPQRQEIKLSTSLGVIQKINNIDQVV